jgi:outer membrane lipoprotein-sorting protein
MNMRFLKSFLWIAVPFFLFHPLTTLGQEDPLTAGEIVEKAEKFPGNDQRSKITFKIREKDGTERKLVSVRFWKNYQGKNGLDSKTLIFNEYPPDQRGSAFMSWSYRAEAGKPDEQWIYIPFIRKVTRIPGKGDESFQGSDLKASDMTPREVNLDRHSLVREETIENKDYYVIKSSPKQNDPNYPYSKVVKWITKDNFLKERLDYYDENEILVKKQHISWKQVGKVWVWEKVVMTNSVNSNQTVLTFSDIRIGTGLSDNLFSERSMKAGLAKIR